MFRRIREHEESSPFSYFPGCKTAEGRVQRGVRAHRGRPLLRTALLLSSSGCEWPWALRDAVPAFSEWRTLSKLHFGFSQWVCCAFVGTCVERNVTIFRPTLGTSLVVDGGHSPLCLLVVVSYLPDFLSAARSWESGVSKEEDEAHFWKAASWRQERKGPNELLVTLTVRLTFLRTVLWLAALTAVSVSAGLLLNIYMVSDVQNEQFKSQVIEKYFLSVTLYNLSPRSPQ